MRTPITIAISGSTDCSAMGGNGPPLRLLRLQDSGHFLFMRDIRRISLTTSTTSSKVARRVPRRVCCGALSATGSRHIINMSMQDSVAYRNNAEQVRGPHANASHANCASESIRVGGLRGARQGRAEGIAFQISVRFGGIGAFRSHLRAAGVWVDAG